MGALLRTNTSLIHATLHLAFPQMGFAHSDGGRLLPGPFSFLTTISLLKQGSTRPIRLTSVPYQVQTSPRTLIPLHGLLSRNSCAYSMVFEHLMPWLMNSFCCGPIYFSSSATCPLCLW